VLRDGLDDLRGDGTIDPDAADADAQVSADVTVVTAVVAMSVAGLTQGLVMDMKSNDDPSRYPKSIQFAFQLWWLKLRPNQSSTVHKIRSAIFGFGGLIGVLLYFFVVYVIFMPILPRGPSASLAVIVTVAACYWISYRFCLWLWPNQMEQARRETVEAIKEEWHNHSHE